MPNTTKMNGSRYMMTTTELGGIMGLVSSKKNPEFTTEEQQNLITQSGGRGAVPTDVMRAYLSRLGFGYDSKVIAFMNLKGGIGKTTSCISMATRALQYGYKTCILDLDSQASASLAFDQTPEDDDPIFCDVWQKPHEMLMGSLRRIENQFYILPSSLENGLLDSMLVNPAAQKTAVKGVCNTLRLNEFDLVMIDCPPSLGTAVISTVCAADTIVVPICSDAFSMKGLALTLNEIASICETFNLPKPDIRILYTKYDRRIKLTHDIASTLEDRYPDYMMPNPIRTSSEFSNALQRKQTVFASAKKSSAKADYDACTRDILHLNSFFQGGLAHG
ncbi:MAG: ParA family protein [Pseudomonadales bacterium]|nr:ParA family protein [Pseudomonadales bacterium]